MPTRRLDALDGLRGLTAVGIVVLHVWMFDHGDAGHPDKGALDLLIGELRLGVPLFFALSGFFVHRAFVAASLAGRDRPRLRSYARKRAARILPAYWLALALAFALTTATNHPMAVGVGDLGWFLLFSQALSGDLVARLDPPMWTLGVEVAFYVSLPVFALLVQRLPRGRQAWWCGAVVLVGWLSVAAHALVGLGDRFDVLLPVHLVAFGSGMLVVTLTHGRSAGAGRARGLLVAGIALVVLDGVWHGLGLGPRTLREVGADLPASAGFALIIASYALHDRRARVLGSFPARWAGTLSLGIYLLHFPAIVLLRTQERWPEQLGLALAAVLGLAVAGAWLSWQLVEAPALRWAARRVTSSPGGTSAPPAERTAGRSPATTPPHPTPRSQQGHPATASASR